MRLMTPAPEAMTSEQRAVYDETVAGKRGRMPAPMRAWIESPELARHGQRLGAFLRYDTTLPARLSELAILVTARHWTSQYEWYAHRSEALKAGLEPEIVAAIAERRPPPFKDEAARIVYDYGRALHETTVVPEALHAEAVRILGQRGVVELVGVLGYYTLVAMTLNAFEIGLPEGETAELRR
ncbi:MAG: carboxymuconolactone decarboxylase family protein [Rhizobiales bacterium]|nr:carboxymuconolactone decarboxylase family protein [Hyphomicrobiales bacterium]